MKLKYVLTAFAATAMGGFANDEVVGIAENEAPKTIISTTPADEEFGFSTLSNNETLMAGKRADGRRLEEWSKAQKANVKFGGYIIGKYGWDSRSFDEAASQQDGFNLRLVRLYVDGYVFRDFKYRLQLEVNNTPHVKDATLEWVHWKEFSIKAGQFKRAFTFEDPYNPFDVGVGDYSQLTKKLSGFSDRIGGEASNNGGRDLGIQFQGDVLPVGKDKHPLIHYQVGVFNGQGINGWDKNKQKDFMGTIQFRPIKDLYIGAFGWKGNYTKDGVTVDRNRFDVGVKYESDWTVRAEYARSWGHKISDYAYDVVSYNPTYDKSGNMVVDDNNNPVMQETKTTKYANTLNAAAQNRGKVADAFYATVGIPCAKWLKAYVKYDLYRDYANWDDNNTSIYSGALNFKFTKNLYFQAQYNFVNDKQYKFDATSNKFVLDPKKSSKYSQLWAQMYVRF